jgi:hypothetical protein
MSFNELDNNISTQALRSDRMIENITQSGTVCTLNITSVMKSKQL